MSPPAQPAAPETTVQTENPADAQTRPPAHAVQTTRGASGARVRHLTNARGYELAVWAETPQNTFLVPEIHSCFVHWSPEASH